MRKEGEIKFKIKYTNEYLGLLSIYMAEWTHRDDLFWNLIFKEFIAGLTVALLPYIGLVDSDFSERFKGVLFPCLGIGFAILFCIIGYRQAQGFIAIGRTINSLIQCIEPDELKRMQTDNIKYFDNIAFPLAVVLLMSAALLLVSCIGLIFIIC